MVRKEHIIEEIQRTAKANGGAPLGQNRFEAETGIRATDWLGRHWRNWSEALIEAGYAPNNWQSAFPESQALGMLADLIRECGRFPVKAELMLKRRRDSAFPSYQVFRRLGGKAEIAAKLLKFCADRGGLDDVIVLCEPLVKIAEQADRAEAIEETDLGFVYLMKSGRFFKIGQTNATGRREYELAIQMPERAELVHEIKTDDPRGIEAYWHKRFAEKRKNGEWFDLCAADVAAFRRRKFQ